MTSASIGSITSRSTGANPFPAEATVQVPESLPPRTLYVDERTTRDLSGGRARHPFPPGDEGAAEGDAPGARQAADAVRGRGGVCRRGARDDLRHQPPQARDR